MSEEGKFLWEKVADDSFNLIKEKLCIVPRLPFPYFDKLFEVKSDDVKLELESSYPKRSFHLHISM